MPPKKQSAIGSVLATDPLSSISTFLHNEVRRCRKQVEVASKKKKKACRKTLVLSDGFIFEEEKDYPDYIGLWNALITLDYFLVMTNKQRTKKNSVDLSILENARRQADGAPPSFDIIPNEFVQVEGVPGYLNHDDRELFVSTTLMFQKIRETVLHQMFHDATPIPTDPPVNIVSLRSSVISMHQVTLELLSRLRQ